MQIIKNICRWLFGWIKGRTGAMALTTFLSLLWFVIDWCLDTTFRPMSDWMLYAVNIAAALLLLAPWMTTRRVWVQLIVLVALDLLFEANLIYNRTYLTAIPADSYGLAGNMADFTASVTDSIRWADAGFPVILIAGIALTLRTGLADVRHRIARWLSLTALFAVAAGAGIMARGGFYNAYDSLVQSCYYFTCGTPTYTIGGHVIYNIIDKGRNSKLTDSDRREVERWFADHETFAAPSDSTASRRNLVIVLCESLESWAVEGSVGGKAIAPYLRSLIDDSTTFYAPRVLTQVAAGHSIDGQLIYTTGLLPTINSVYSMKYPSATYPSINKILKANRGAESILMTSDKIFTWNQGTIARAFGYDSIFSRADWNMDETILRKLTDGSFLRQSVAELEKGKVWPEGTPAMMTFITYSGHFPFKISDELRDSGFNISSAPLSERIKDYATITHYVDSQLPTLIEYLKSRSDWQETLVVILGDHEGLGLERAELRAWSPEASALVDAGKFTPMIILNAPVAGRYDGVMGQVDVLPTVLDMLGLHKGWRGMGVSALSPSKIPAAYTSVPQELIGDTTGVAPAAVEHMRTARRISDRIIVHDMLK